MIKEIKLWALKLDFLYLRSYYYMFLSTCKKYYQDIQILKSKHKNPKSYFSPINDFNIFKTSDVYNWF